MDTLMIQILDKKFFMNLASNGNVVAIQNNLAMKKSIPRQIKPHDLIRTTIT